MNRIDELINKFLDSEISNLELEELQKLLNDDFNYKSLKSFQLIEKTLKDIKTEKAPELFTEKLMTKILMLNKSRNERKSFLPIIINSIFVLLIIFFVVIYFIYANMDIRNSEFNLLIESKINLINSFLPTLKKIFINKIVIFFSSIISLLLLIIFYYIFEEHKIFKKKLENM